MSKNNIKDLVIKAKTDKDAEETVIKYFINKYSGKILGRYFFYPKIGDYQDILQYARIGIWQGINYYNPKYENLNIECYILKNMENKVIEAIKTSTRQCRNIENECSRFVKQEIGYKDLFDNLTDKMNIEQDVIKKEFRQVLNSIQFSECEKTVLEYKINKDMSLKGISEVTGLSVKSVDNAYTRIKSKIKNNNDVVEYLNL